MSEQKIKVLARKCVICWVAFAVCLGVSIGLIVGGFFTPPKGVIDGSVLKAVGELFAFAALAVGGHALTLGYDLKVSRGDTSMEINNNNDTK